LPVLEDDLQKRLMALLPSYASAQNPVDATAQAIGEVGYAPMVELVAQSERIDTILLISSLANPERAKKLAMEMAELTATLDKPILLSTYTTATPASIAAVAAAGIPCYTSMPSCARAIKALVDYGRFRERLARRKPVAETVPALRDEVSRALSASAPVLTEVASKKLLARYGVRLPPEALAASEDEAVAAAAKIGGTVALKVQSPDILHKTEAGAVMLNLSGDAAVRDGYRVVLARAKAAYPNATIDGVLVQAMARRGREMILGVTRDPDFGPMLMVGLGGIHVEVLKDVAFAPVPLGAEEALDLIGQLKGSALLDAVRGEPAADCDALAALMVALSRFAADHADAIAEIDLNPVIVHAAGEGLTIVDALIVKS
jgi:acyl-CoA synthetase (NDP forming)